MLDVTIAMLVAVCFVLANAYACLCNRLLALPDHEPDKESSS